MAEGLEERVIVLKGSMDADHISGQVEVEGARDERGQEVEDIRWR